MIDVSAKIAQARAHFEAGRAEQARAFLERALRQNPGHPELASAMALVLMSMGRLELALYNAERAVQARPREPAFLQNLANILAQLGRHNEAITAYEQALASDPRSTGCRLGISHALRLVYRFAEATAHLREGIAVAPADIELQSSLAQLLLKQARVEESVEAAEHALSLASSDLGAAATLALAVNYLPGADGPRTLAANRLAGRLYSAAAPRRLTHPNSREPDRPIRVGILSGDLRSHAVAFFLEPFLEHHDRQSLHITCYSTTRPLDDVTGRLKSQAAAWRDLHGAPQDAIAAAIHADRTDILLELSGHMAGHNLPAIAMRPAPIQANFLGYPGTTGVPEISHRFVESLTDPAGAEPFATETLVRIDPSFLCYRPPESAPQPARHAASSVVFGSFNSAPKINRQVIRLWSRLLKELPESTLTLKALEFYDPALAPDISSRFATEGIDPARIHIHIVKPTLESHLAAYNDIDIALDTFPYNGTTTTFEALLMGVPVITLRGDRHVARVSSAILTNLGLTYLIADTEDDYIRIAKGLAADAPRRASLRDSLRPRLTSSVLCDAPAYGRRMSDSLREIWRQWCAPPRPT